MSESSFADNFVSIPATTNHYQQQAILCVEREVDIRVLQERDEQIRELENNIVKVNEIFTDVAKLVHDQGGVIDSIEWHVDDTQVNVVSANQQLTKTVTYQSSTRRKRIILIAIMLVVLTIVVLILVLTLGK